MRISGVYGVYFDLDKVEMIVAKKDEQKVYVYLSGDRKCWFESSDPAATACEIAGLVAGQRKMEVAIELDWSKSPW